jgi:hypothetical protein
MKVQRWYCHGIIFQTQPPLPFHSQGMLSCIKLVTSDYESVHAGASH